MTTAFLAGKFIRNERKSLFSLREALQLHKGSGKRGKGFLYAVHYEGRRR